MEINCIGSTRHDNQNLEFDHWPVHITLEGHIGPVVAIAWSQDGSRLASASYDETIVIWNTSTSQCTSTLEGHSGSMNSIAWSEDGSLLASGSAGKTVCIWDSATGENRFSIRIHYSLQIHARG
ncbi:NACHT nucleoside triphosphatase [Penicillium sp. IBT 31633x]|nr:NACHT nucleoside triphosphatase [Penicillium sp. IBT 31633x]